MTFLNFVNTDISFWHAVIIFVGVLPNPPPLPTFEVELSKAILEGKLKDRPWSSQFFRRCAKFYTKLKPYPSRRDYKNISNHLSNTFPDLGHPVSTNFP